MRSSNVTWDAARLLRAEDRELKDRVGFLEEGVDEASGIVGGGRSWRYGGGLH